MTGPSWTGDPGDWFPADKAEVWLDRPPLAGERQRFGQEDILLGQEELTLQCDLNIEFQIPDVPAGGYSVIVDTFERFLGGSGERRTDPMSLTVTAP